MIPIGKGSRAIISLGSNIEPRHEYIRRALSALGSLPETSLEKTSAVIETEPVEVPPEYSECKFLNCVAICRTSLEVHRFAALMHGIEDDLGRVRTIRNGPRTIDLDLIDFDGMRLCEPDLVLPHPRARGREFVMRPLAELGVTL